MWREIFDEGKKIKDEEGTLGGKRIRLKIKKERISIERTNECREEIRDLDGRKIEAKNLKKREDGKKKIFEGLKKGEEEKKKKLYLIILKKFWK